MPIGTQKRSIEWCHFQWPWMTPKPNFKVTPLFDAEYLRNGTTRQRHRPSYSGIPIGTYTFPPQERHSYNLEWLSETFNDKKHCVASLRQLSFSCSQWRHTHPAGLHYKWQTVLNLTTSTVELHSHVILIGKYLDAVVVDLVLPFVLILAILQVAFSDAGEVISYLLPAMLRAQLAEIADSNASWCLDLFNGHYLCLKWMLLHPPTQCPEIYTATY